MVSLLLVLTMFGCRQPGGGSESDSGSDTDGDSAVGVDTQDSAVIDTADSADTGEVGGQAPCPVVGGFEHFVTRDGDQLLDGDEVLRFSSFNVPNLHMLEDPDWHLPDPWEQQDAICSLVQMGGNVARIYTLSVGESSTDVPRHVSAPGEFSEDLFVALDHAVAEAGEHGVRLVIPFVDQ
ncbi:MAG: hypothetical protein QGG40_20760, partial [Myxococcota bacterium]|nr:hypothetical protein [Myxococcota bacterium]